MESVFITRTPNLWSKVFVLFQCGRWARHCYITSLLTLHWSINNRPIQVVNNRPIYVVGCTWSSNTCKVLYFWFGGQNDLLRTMWYFIIQPILHLYNILGLVSGKFKISRLYIYWTIASWSAGSAYLEVDHVLAEFEKNGPKNIFYIYIYKNGLRWPLSSEPKSSGPLLR